MATQPEHGFDFIYGRWQVHNRKLRDQTDPACDEWIDFEGTSEAFPVLDGVGHIDQIHFLDPPGGPFVGMTLRLFDPAEQQWQIWWSSTRAPGRLDPPMSGGFDGAHGVFFGDDEVSGQPIKLRFDWYADTSSPRWEQRFSFDNGETWIHNWTMTLTRAD